MSSSKRCFSCDHIVLCCLCSVLNVLCLLRHQQFVDTFIPCRCIWPSSEKSEPFVAGDEKLLLYEEVKELRTLSGRVAPSLRPRIEKIIQRERVECLLASAVLKQLKLLPQVGGGRNESLLPVSSYLFTKIDALMRQIAVSNSQ